MALAASTVVDVRAGGSDTNGAGFNGANTNMLTNLTATNGNTSSPVVSSASYSFVSADVGNWLYIKSGTNWIPGWYQIASVSSGAATLSAGAGQGYISVVPSTTTSSNQPLAPATAVGVSTVASPTAGTFSVDYSQQNAATRAVTDAVTNGTTTVTSATAAFTVAMKGNLIYVAGGSASLAAGWYEVVQVTNATTITVDRTIASGTGATLNLGGGLASLGMSGAFATVAGMLVFLAYSASVYPITSATTNVSGGCLTAAIGVNYVGYNGSRSKTSTDTTRPTLQLASGVSSATIMAGTNNTPYVHNIILDGNSQTTSAGMFHSGNVFDCKFINFTNYAWAQNNTTIGGGFRLEAASCSVTGLYVFKVGYLDGCETHDCTIATSLGGVFYAASVCVNCLAYNHTGSNSNGFMACVLLINCDSINCGGYGDYAYNTNGTRINCISMGNTNYGYGTNGAIVTLYNCADYNNTAGRLSPSANFTDVNPIALTADPFVATASYNFALNTNSGGGGLLRAAGYPGTFPRGLTASYDDVGAVQHPDPTGGAAGMLYVPSLDGVC